MICRSKGKSQISYEEKKKSDIFRHIFVKTEKENVEANRPNHQEFSTNQDH